MLASALLFLRGNDGFILQKVYPAGAGLETQPQHVRHRTLRRCPRRPDRHQPARTVSVWRSAWSLLPEVARVEAVMAEAVVWLILEQMPRQKPMARLGCLPLGASVRTNTLQLTQSLEVSCPRFITGDLNSAEGLPFARRRAQT